ncbi:MAG TPA: tetratricopeptide repeat protein [Sedimentisphaerales bacterium]|nr:tetratricopeptide repeat protein [Sedimentisphaerales bacterium]
MPENSNNNDDLGRARALFAKGQDAAESKNFDEAIALYIEGLRWVPDAVQEGHIKLRELAFQRQSSGGAKPTDAEIAEHSGGDTALEQMLNAEYLLAKDPSHLSYAESILKAASAGGYKGTAKWMADMIFLANNRAKKPSFQIYVLLKESYEGIGRLDRAIAALERAIKVKGVDAELSGELARLSEKLGVGRIARESEDEPLEGIEEEEAAGGQEMEEEVSGGELGPIPGEYLDASLARATGFFEKARRVATVGDYDFAIELYLKGIGCTPDALHDGHIPLFEMALQRQRKGGKRPSMMERVKRMRRKTPLEQMLNAEYLFAKDPDHLASGGEMLKAAVAGGFTKTANWLANYIFQANNSAKKPSLQIYVLLKDSYVALGQFEKALVACQRAARLRPDDDRIADELKNLTAEMTVAKGRYDQDGDFRKAIKDREVQERLHSQESIVKTKDYRQEAVEEARKALAEDPNLAKNIYNLAQALSDLQDDAGENEAIELLERAYKSKSDFSYAQRAGQVRIKQLKRKIREAKEAVDGGSGDERTKARAAELSANLNHAELEHYRQCVENYPTDLQAKYEYGTRLVRNKQYDEAIPLFQEAQRDPRHKISAMDKIGLCFFMKGWFTDAIDVFTQAIESYEIKDDGIGKELRYNLARSYEEQGDSEKALEIYRRIAQVDFAFRDVRQRVDKLRGMGTGPDSL